MNKLTCWLKVGRLDLALEEAKLGDNNYCYNGQFLTFGEALLSYLNSKDQPMLH